MSGHYICDCCGYDGGEHAKGCRNYQPFTTEQLDKLQFGKVLHERPPLPDGEAVAWRWRSIFNEDHWCYDTKKPVFDNDQYIAEPLYASPPPASAIKIVPDGPPCPTCGFRLVQREQSPFVADDE